MNDDLLELKIDIKTNNDIAYQEMALLLDKPEFLRMLPSLRETYKITEEIPLEDYCEYSKDFIFKIHLNDPGKIYLDKYTRLPELKKRFPDIAVHLDESGAMLYPDRLDAECNLICFEFNRPYYFTEIIRQALFCKKVDDTYYGATQGTVIDASEFGPMEYTLPQAAIFISPTSTYEDVKEAFREVKEMIKTDRRLSYYQPRLDTVSNIREYRSWYWDRLKGKTYTEISDDWITNHPEIKNIDAVSDVNFILKGVKKYKELLKS